MIYIRFNLSKLRTFINKLRLNQIIHWYIVITLKFNYKCEQLAQIKTYVLYILKYNLENKFLKSKINK